MKNMMNLIYGLGGFTSGFACATFVTLCLVMKHKDKY